MDQYRGKNREILERVKKRSRNSMSSSNNYTHHSLELTSILLSQVCDYYSSDWLVPFSVFNIEMFRDKTFKIQSLTIVDTATMNTSSNHNSNSKYLLVKKLTTITIITTKELFFKQPKYVWTKILNTIYI